MRLVMACLITLVAASNAWCELSLQKTTVHNGDVALLRWRGDPLSFGVARFRDHVIYLSPDSDGAVALLPVGLDTPPGTYPVTAALVDETGRTIPRELSLQVVAKERPLEHLQLPERMVTPSARDSARIARENKRLKAIYQRRSERSWTRFVRPVNDPISSVFGKRRMMNGKPRAPHSGTDFRSAAGTPVFSISNGRTVLVDELFYTGKTVVVDHGEGLLSIYAHLSETAVETGQALLAGETLGKVGSTGRSTGAHLHLSVRLLGERVDPVSLLSVLDE